MTTNGNGKNKKDETTKRGLRGGGSSHRRGLGGGGSSHHSRQSPTRRDTTDLISPSLPMSNLPSPHRGLRRPLEEVRAKSEAAAMLATGGTSSGDDVITTCLANSIDPATTLERQQQQSPSHTTNRTVVGSGDNKGLSFLGSRDKGLANRACVTCQIQPQTRNLKTDVVLQRSANNNNDTLEQSGAIISHISTSSNSLYSFGSIQAFPSSPNPPTPITTQPGAVHVNPIVPAIVTRRLNHNIGSEQITNADNNNNSEASEAAEEIIVTAVTVDEDDLEKSIRNRILHEAVEADVVTKSCWKKKKTSLLLICIVVILAGITIGTLTEKLGNDSNSTPEQQENSNSMEPTTTMELIRERGHLLCGVYAFRNGFANTAYNGEVSGINMDQCRAVAIAVFGDPDRVEPVIVTGQDRLPMLANGTIDLLSTPATHTMGRDVHDRQSNTGFSFSTPYLYSGTVFAGRPQFVDCAERLDYASNGTCSDLKVCAHFASTQYITALKLLPSSIVKPRTTIVQIADALVDGTCNVAAVETVGVERKRLDDYGWEGPFKAGTKLFSKDPLTLVTREEDPEWSSLVDLVVNMFFLAEANNITKTNAAKMASLFEDDPIMSARAVAIVSQFGNYGDLYQRHLQDILPRRGLNTLYTSSNSDSGLMYSHPLGVLGAEGPGPIAGMTLQKILDRGHLRCGVIPRPGFARLEEDFSWSGFDGSWSGFDIQFCRGIAAALFGGDAEAVVFVNISGDSGKAYSALATNQLDTVAGVRVTLQARYREPTTGKGYAFSTPTFYDNDVGDAFAFVTNQVDYQWSDFVYWVISSLVYAEEMAITQTESDEMPLTSVFGEGFEMMLQHAVNAVGSYGQIYNQTLAETIPRSGRNLLQMHYNTMQGPQQYPIPAL